MDTIPDDKLRSGSVKLSKFDASEIAPSVITENFQNKQTTKTNRKSCQKLFLSFTVPNKHAFDPQGLCLRA